MTPMKKIFWAYGILLSCVLGFTSCHKQNDLPIINEAPEVPEGPYELKKPTFVRKSGYVNQGIPFFFFVQNDRFERIPGIPVYASVSHGVLLKDTVQTSAVGAASFDWTMGSATGRQTITVGADVRHGNSKVFHVMAYEYCDPYSDPFQSPLVSGSFTDPRDGEVYPTITYCNQTWMTENLRYNASGSWLNPDNPNLKYGRLYNWSTLMNGASSSASVPSGVQGICPSGWHIPSDEEWTILELALGLPIEEADETMFRGEHGREMKALSIPGWLGSNRSYFAVLPAGYHSSQGFTSLGTLATFASSTLESSLVWTRIITTNSFVRRDLNITVSTSGRSCRCLQD